jgi:hypothetical protein
VRGIISLHPVGYNEQGHNLLVALTVAAEQVMGDPALASGLEGTRWHHELTDDPPGPAPESGNLSVAGRRADGQE